MPFCKYSPDVKDIIVHHALHGSSFQELRNLTPHQHFSKRSLTRWLVLKADTGKPCRDSAEYHKRGRRNRFNEDELLVLQDVVAHNPGLYLVEIQKRMKDITGKEVSTETIRNDLRTRLGLSLVQTRGVDPRQSPEDRASYITRIAGVPVEYLVFIDESGVTAKDTYRIKSWTPKGTQSKREVRVRESEHLTLLPAVTEAGMIAGTVFKGAVERVHVEMFLKRHLLPVMNRFPGRHSVLVLDNAKIHHGSVITAICEQAGIRVVYLPAYSPDFNPIEKGFHCIKRALKREQKWQVAVDPADYLLHVAGRVLTRELMRPLFVSSGYATTHTWENLDAHQ